MMVTLRQLALIVAGILLSAGMAKGDCVSLVKGYLALDVRSCGRLKPEMTFDVNQERHAFIKDLPAPEQKKFWNSYRGLIIKGKVARSLAVRSGLNSSKGALNGEDISVFVHPDKNNTCRGLPGKRIKGYVSEACCEGGGDPPCLLSSAYVLKNYKVIGKASSSAGNASKTKAKKSKLYKRADKEFRQKRFEKAARYYEGVRSRGNLDIVGHYKLAYSYRQIDRCAKAIPPLEYIADKGEKKEFWADEEKIIRRANFLMARCYAKVNKPGFAVTILEGYLIDPATYRREIKGSLTHKDFGWIHTSKEYRKYKQAAERKLR